MPAGGLEVVGGRGECVSGRIPDIPSAVAVKVHRVLVVGGGDKLRLPHGAGPGAKHAIGFDVTVLQDIQCGQQLVVRKAGAAAFMGQGGQRANHLPAAHVLTVVALQSPDSGQDVAVDTVALLDGIQSLFLRAQPAAPGRYALV